MTTPEDTELRDAVLAILIEEYKQDCNYDALVRLVNLITLHTQRAVVDELKILEKSEIANISIKKMRIRISGRIAHLTNHTEAGEK